MAPAALDQGRLLCLAGPVPPWWRAHGFPVELFAVTDIAVARNGTGELGGQTNASQLISLRPPSQARPPSQENRPLHGR
jgi:hypothetical protein